MTKPILWIATSNQDKVLEYQKLLPNYQIKTLVDLPFAYEEPEENGTTFEENALIKARDLANKLQAPVIGDDSGICVTALDGFPGIYSKRWASPITDWPTICQLLLAKVAANPKAAKTAKMVTVLAWYNPLTNEEALFRGEMEGQLNNKVELGDGRCFGYDLVFRPGDSLETYSQMPLDQKNFTSARQKAAQKLAQFLKERMQNDSKN
ncbi:XTP/dITP diphosphohydrolase [Entomoplasma freundtii]|uniref:DITP/XTP pyrophosphatase n=1 Tax=Entomoplasma freundtii TaxID=74700 RepID=A0A2K8NSD4_9MOLU|nr:non-canonical purine NTP pyrophosphatase [Entomoplasma freundtii]ATZ16466.1 dITP/XTP pyrophosphatase [Entomoplasma freundtii]TDY55995.1 XTP/dITP diphosphohydrolase [Entomoplasma freundtii]